jgi:hypothetical protein
MPFDSLGLAISDNSGGLCFVGCAKYRIWMNPTLPRPAIEELKALFTEEFGQSITEDEAQVIALRLLRLLALLLGSSVERKPR